LRRLSVISDVHANLEALEAVLDEVEGLEVICLGDFVDYGADPNEVIKELRRVGARSIMGNHDSAALTGDTTLFNPRAAMSAMWTRTRLTDESRQYLEVLPEELRIRFDDAELYFAHGSPDDHLWEYVDPRTDSNLFGFFLDRLRVQGIGLGHTHVPFVWREKQGVVFNPGSVGQPRDGDRRAAYAVVTVSMGLVEVELKRVEYDYETAASKIIAAGLPAAHAERLRTGI
jgi:putative phosphoesterase